MAAACLHEGRPLTLAAKSAISQSLRELPILVEEVVEIYFVLSRHLVSFTAVFRGRTKFVRSQKPKSRKSRRRRTRRGSRKGATTTDVSCAKTPSFRCHSRRHFLSLHSTGHFLSGFGENKEGTRENKKKGEFLRHARCPPSSPKRATSVSPELALTFPHSLSLARSAASCHPGLEQKSQSRLFFLQQHVRTEPSNRVVPDGDSIDESQK